MAVIFVTRPAPVPAAPKVVADSRSFWIESLDRSLVVPFDNDPVRIRTGALGLEEAPGDPAFSSSPGVEGGFFEEDVTPMRRVLLPLAIAADTQEQVWAAKRLIRQVVRGGIKTPEGSFRLVCSSASGVRELGLEYLAGLEGEGQSLPWWDQFALDLMAPDPFARDRVSRSVEFRVSASSLVMVSDDPASAGPRGLASSVVIGEDMPVDVASEVPVHARLDVFGPFDPLQVSASTGLDIRIPSGVPAGSQFTAVLDPRNRSFRLDGQPAAGLIARGSRIGAPFRPGLNMLSVAASGANDDSRIVLSWRGGWRSLW